MPYGHSSSSGHGRRATAYRWSPSVLPPSSRHARRSRRRTSISNAIQEPSTEATSRVQRRTRRTQRRPAVRTVTPRPSAGVSRLFGKMAASLATGLWEMVVDMLTTRQRVSDSYARIVSFFLAIAAMIHSPAFLALGGFMFLHRFLDWLSDMATEASFEEYEENKRRLCIHRKTSVNAPPTPEAIRQAWEAACGSLMGKLLAGTLLSDLEPAVDQSYLRAEDGTIVGRRPGLKGWLRENCPDMLPHYKALMSYKALADKLRSALGIEEPDTLAGVLDFGGGATPKSLHFLERFDLRKTNEKTVLDGIRSLFGDTAARTGSDGAEELVDGPTKISVKTMPAQGIIAVADDDATAVTEIVVGQKIEPKTSVDAVLARKTVGDALGHVADAGGAGSVKGAWTMAALDAAVRERLGLCWMRRTGRARRAA